MGGAALPGVGRTAVWVSGLRAVENARPDRLFDDPFAAVFVEAFAEAFVEAFVEAGDGVQGAGVPGAAAVPVGTSEFLAIRTRFYDDQARAATASGARQVV